MISRSMGRRYSKALLALALESGEPLDTLQEEVESFSKALFADGRTINFLTNPNVSVEDRLKGFDKILHISSISSKHLGFGICLVCSCNCELVSIFG